MMIYGILRAESMGTKHGRHIHRDLTPIFMVILITKLITNDD